MRTHSVLLLALLTAVGATTSIAQATIDGFIVGKKQDFLQTSDATPTSSAIIGDPNGPYHFSANLTGTGLNLFSPAPKVTTPASVQYPLTGDTTDVGVARNYSTKAALDAAFPNSSGNYTFTAGTLSLPISLGNSDGYPAEIPKITNGIWDYQGRFVVNATSGMYLYFSNFSAYYSGAGGMVLFSVYGVSGETLVSEIVSAQSTRLNGLSTDSLMTSYPLAGGILQPNQIYYAELSFVRFTNLNTTFLGSLNAVGAAAFVHSTGFTLSTYPLTIPPSINAQSANQTVMEGDSVTFGVTASGTPAPTYQWRKNNIEISGATNSTYTIANPTLADIGNYTVVVTNTAGTVTSTAAALMVISRPSITVRPNSKVVAEGQPVSFAVAAAGSGLTYEWRHNRQILPGTTGTTLNISAASLSDRGYYEVIVTNSAGGYSSTLFYLAVGIANPTIRAWGDYPATPPTNIESIADIAVGGAMVALKNNGTVFAWSSYSYGPVNVPSNLGNVVAVAAGFSHALALKDDGTVVGWGENFAGQATPPMGLSGVVAIAAGQYESLALKSDGTVVGWGGNQYGQSTIPAGLKNVVAIRTGRYQTIVLKSDGSIVTWGYYSGSSYVIPSGATDIAMIAGGESNGVGLKRDGTVVAWGQDYAGSTVVPPGLSGILAVAAGGDYALALKPDGTVFGWGRNYQNQTTPPPGLNGVIFVAAGGWQSLAVTRTVATAPAFTTHPSNQSVIAGNSVTFTAVASGAPVPTFQWQKGGVTINGATGNTYTITNAVAGDAGSYSVIATNSVGSATSNTAVLTFIAPPSNAVITFMVQ